LRPGGSVKIDILGQFFDTTKKKQKLSIIIKVKRNRQSNKTLYWINSLKSMKNCCRSEIGIEAAKNDKLFKQRKEKKKRIINFIFIVFTFALRFA
jgi:hypothetical protein